MYACGFVLSALQPHPGLNLTHIVTDTLCERRAAGGARLRLVARAEAAVKNTVEDRSAILDLVEVPLGDLELGEGDNLLRREDRELDVLAGGGEEAGSAPEVTELLESVAGAVPASLPSWRRR